MDVAETVDYARSTYTKFFRGAEWNIGIVRSPIHAFLKPDFKPDIRWLPAPERGKFYADPFGIVRDGKLCLLFEEFDYGTGKGVISSVEVDSRTSKPQVAMDARFHLSYPYVVEHEGDIFCIPETSYAGEVALYRALEFPTCWAKEVVLLSNFPGVDSTLFQHEGRWYLTCTNQSAGANSSLFVCHAPNLFGPWKPHASNPVKMNSRSSRPAGTPFLYNGVLFRPAQDCTDSYGGRVVINRVKKLTPTDFEEEEAAIIEPFSGSPYPMGVHTISSVGDITLIDGRRNVFIKRAMIAGLRRKMRRETGD